MERIDAFFNANSIEDDVKKEWIFLLTVGASTYAMPGTLFAPAKPEEKSGNSEQHISSAPWEMAKRFCFHTRVQVQNESFTVFVTELLQIVEHCNFGTALNCMLRKTCVRDSWQKPLPLQNRNRGKKRNAVFIVRLLTSQADLRSKRVNVDYWERTKLWGHGATTDDNCFCVCLSAGFFVVHVSVSRNGMQAAINRRQLFSSGSLKKAYYEQPIKTKGKWIWTCAATARQKRNPSRWRHAGPARLTKELWRHESGRETWK